MKEIKSEFKKTVCVQCKWLDRIGRGDMWYDYLCAKPAVQKKEYSHVTGKTTTWRPYCSQINRDGKCPHFERKDLTKTAG